MVRHSVERGRVEIYWTPVSDLVNRIAFVTARQKGERDSFAAVAYFIDDTLSLVKDVVRLQ